MGSVQSAAGRVPKKRRLSAFEAAAKAPGIGGDEDVPSTSASHESLAHFVQLGLDTFETTPRITVSRKLDGMEVYEVYIYNNPLDWWKVTAPESPILAALARRVLATPASQAQSERCTFSTSGGQP